MTAERRPPSASRGDEAAGMTVEGSALIAVILGAMAWLVVRGARRSSPPGTAIDGADSAGRRNGAAYLPLLQHPSSRRPLMSPTEPLSYLRRHALTILTIRALKGDDV